MWLCTTHLTQIVVPISCLITAGPMDPFAGLWRSSPGRGVFGRMFFVGLEKHAKKMGVCFC